MKIYLFKIAVILLAAGLVLAGVISGAANSPRIRINGAFVHIPADDQPPVIVDNRTLVPLRAVMEALGFDVHWNDTTRTITLSNVTHVGSVWIMLPLEEIPHEMGFPVREDTWTHFPGNMYISNAQNADGLIIPLDVPPQIINNRTMVPVRAISEASGMDVDWDGANLIVDIQTPPNTPEPLPPVQDQPPQLIIEGGNNPWIELPDGTIITPQQPGNQQQQPLPPTDNTPEPAPPAVDGIPRSAITLPNRVLTDAEMSDWQAEYAELGGANEFELEVVRLVNEVRAEHNLAPFSICPTLMMAARFKSQSMSDLDYMSHDGVYGAPWDLMRAFGASPGFAAENIARGQNSPESVMQSWMNSPGHRDNILGANYTVIGVGAHRDASGRIAWTQMFNDR